MPITVDRARTEAGSTQAKAEIPLLFEDPERVTHVGRGQWLPRLVIDVIFDAQRRTLCLLALGSISRDHGVRHGGNSDGAHRCRRM